MNSPFQKLLALVALDAAIMAKQGERATVQKSIDQEYRELDELEKLQSQHAAAVNEARRVVEEHEKSMQVLQQREAIFNQQQDLQRQLDDVNVMLSKFDVFEGKQAGGRKQTRSVKGRGASGRRGSKRDELLTVIRDGHGLTRGEILEKMGLKGNKPGEMSVSNALTALTKSNQVRRDGRKYHAA